MSARGTGFQSYPKGEEMRGYRIAGLLGLLATLAVAALAATAAPAAGGTVGPATTQAPNTLNVRFAVTKFVARNRQLVAIGRTIATYQTTGGTYSSATPFSAKVLRIHTGRSSTRGPQAATRICDVLNLTLGPLHLELLGLIVDLNQVVLNIRANSEGGLLGGLLCGLAGSSGLAQTATQLTNVAKTSGLTAGPGFTVPLQGASSGTQQAAQVCTVLDLVLGPLDLNLLGLLVHLDQVHLTVTADPTKGLLGSLLCSLAGGVPTG